VFRIPTIVFLLARFHLSDLRRVAHHQLVPQLGQHLREPQRVARALDPYQRRFL